MKKLASICAIVSLFALIGIYAALVRPAHSTVAITSNVKFDSCGGTNYTRLMPNYCFYTGNTLASQALTINGTCQTITLAGVFGTPSNAVAIDAMIRTTITGANVVGTFDQVTIFWYDSNACTVSLQDNVQVGVKEFVAAANVNVGQFSTRNKIRVFNGQVFYIGTKIAGGAATTGLMYVEGFND